MPIVPSTVLGLDPGTRYLGFAVLREQQLIEYGVRELRNGERPYDVIGQARRIVLRLIALHGPEVVAIEAPYLIPTPRAAVLSTLTQEIHDGPFETYTGHGLWAAWQEGLELRALRSWPAPPRDPPGPAG